ncbi:hypothetical protein [Brevibacillus daliensis]|uniref:hypothetical protein n=1 Tax=Brevibacillus daliensis TaxID=2892995 RepID=UPI001E32B91F|nr:hypothetical protein [Brevibacillus daliensis]
MKKCIYHIGYERVSKRELLERLEIENGFMIQHDRLQEGEEANQEGPPEKELHIILVRYQHRPSEWITFTGTYQILMLEPIPWIDSPIEYHLFGDELIPGNYRRERAPQARIPGRTKLQITAIRDDIVHVMVPNHPSRRYYMKLEHARFARHFPTEMELRLQYFSFPPHPDVLVDWLLREGRKRGMITRFNGEHTERTAFEVWDDLRKEYQLSVSSAILAIKQALVVIDRAGLESEFPNPNVLADISNYNEEEREAFFSYQTVKAALAAVSALLTIDPMDQLQDHLLMDIMIEQQQSRKHS